MTSIGTHRAALRDLPLDDWEPYLLAGSNLPGPRGNLGHIFFLDSFLH